MKGEKEEMCWAFPKRFLGIQLFIPHNLPGSVQTSPSFYR